MRTLFVAALIAGIVMAIPVQGSGAIRLAPKAGDSVTQSELLTYLFAAPQRGDWVRYRLSIDEKTILTKTVGFGIEPFSGEQTAFFETRTQTSGIIATPVQSKPAAGGELVWKMYVDAPNFNDVKRLYSFVAGVIEIGDSLFRLGADSAHEVQPAYHETLQGLVLYGTLPLPDERAGVVHTTIPEDITVSHRTLHSVHTTVDFPAHDLTATGGLLASRVEFWQTPDVPLGIAEIRTTVNGSVYTVTMTGFGHDFLSSIGREFESIPMFPGMR